jgi:hypothetical protein
MYQRLRHDDGANGAPMLRKIADAWRDLTEAGDSAELAIVSNRAPDPANPWYLPGIPGLAGWSLTSRRTGLGAGCDPDCGETFP